MGWVCRGDGSRAGEVVAVVSGLPGFGIVFEAGRAPRRWWAGEDGIRRWADNDQPVDIPMPDAPDVVDATGVSIGNSDIEDSSTQGNGTPEEGRVPILGEYPTQADLP